ncbi:ABC transporter ATP-binding protein [Streptomyces sp. SID13031]|uniref:ABC transporter ATP-binding protein n=1 Tax=Streptomyces sp. SID13031 TaxID=2706046 RepID=UPI0013C7C962|nr:ABC transporter ATP-binding protein [Streptomyces sp. SID13031]NEA33532.1 ABC transporter ATP-binding protein [Streptomyces sp. SID13031]
MTATAEASATATSNAVRPVRFHQVGKAFGQGRKSVVALEGVNLDVAAGEFVCLLGASGCGKTTLLNLVAGLDKPTSGRIELSSSRPAVVFQEAALMPWLTAAGNVELPLRLAGVSKAARRAKAAELLELVRLGGLGDKRPHELSGGMRQRVALARALASTTDNTESGSGAGSASGKPSLLLMDEPFSALDAITRDVLQGELLRIWRATGTAILFVTHDVREAVRLGQRVVLLSSRPGRVVREWDVDGLSGAGETGAVDEINGALRKVISSHAAA